MYRYMDSHPYPGNHMPFPENHCPSCAAPPPQMGYEWGPYRGNYGHPMPVDCHACCNHSCFPGYYGFPPYHQMAPPTPFHWRGCRPMYPEPYPVHYAPAPYNYSMEHPRPEYEKNDSDNYGFPNHGFNEKVGNNVKIEEHEADDGKKEKESLVPAGLKDCSYPIVWIPTGYMKNGEKRASLEQDKNEQSENRHQSHNATSPKSFNKSIEWEPGIWNLWFPPDSNVSRYLKQGGEGKKSQKSEEKNAHFPFPIIWMPQFEKKEEAEGKEHKQKTSASKHAEEPNLSFKIIPVKPLEVDDGGNRSRATQENSGGQGVLNNAEKAADQRYIPVKEREAHGEENTSENIEGKWEGNVSKHVENGGKKKPSDSYKGQSSKLLPVCLRVDPLPRKKKGNGSSRSPSPPGQREKSQETSDDMTNGSSPSGLKGSQESTRNKSQRLEPKKKEIKVVDAVEHKSGQNIESDSECGSQNQILTHTQFPVNLPINLSKGVSDDLAAEKPGVAGGEHQAKTSAERNAEDKISAEASEDQKVINISQPANECKMGEDKAGSKVEENKSDEAPKAKKSNLSDSEAAVIIQSAYRGFEVRKWEPLKKLKQLAKVRDEVEEMRNCIQALEALSECQRDNKQRVIIGETIMRLLLKLDAIQGLHPNLRDVRKSLARELVSLQEKLDSPPSQKPEASVVEEPTAKPVEISTDMEEAKEAIEGLQDKSSEDDFGKASNSAGPSQSLAKEDASVESRDENISEPMSVQEKVQVQSENDTIRAEVKGNVEQQHAADMGSISELEDEQGNAELSSDSGVEGDAELPLVTGEGTNEMGVAESPLVDDTMYDSNAANKIEVGEVADTASPINEGHMEMNELAEQPRGIIEEDTAMNVVPELINKDDKIEAKGDSLPEWEKDGKIEAEMNTVQESDEIGCNKTGDVTMTDCEGNEPEQQQQPQPVAESKNDEIIEAREAIVSDMAPDTASQDDEAEASDMNNKLQEEEALGTEELQPAEVIEKEVPIIEAKEEAEFANSDNPLVSETAKEETPETESAEGGRGRGNQAVIQEETETAKEPDENEKLIEENKKLREMMEQLINAGNQQLTVITNLTGRVKDLERKVSMKKKKLRTIRHRAAAAAAPPPPSPASVRS